MTEFEKVLVTFILTVLASEVLRHFQSKTKVSIKEFDSAMERITTEIVTIKTDRARAWEDHRTFCPEKRDIMTEPEHDLICRKNLAPIYSTISEIKESQVRLSNAMEHMAESMSSMAQAQAKMVTVGDLRDLITVMNGKS